MSIFEYYYQEYKKGYRSAVIYERMSKILCCSPSHVANVVGGHVNLTKRLRNKWAEYMQGESLCGH